MPGLLHFIHLECADHNFYTRINNAIFALHFMICGKAQSLVMESTLFSLYFEDNANTLSIIAPFTFHLRTRHHYLRHFTSPLNYLQETAPLP